MCAATPLFLLHRGTASHICRWLSCAGDTCIAAGAERDGRVAEHGILLPDFNIGLIEYWKMYGFGLMVCEVSRSVVGPLLLEHTLELGWDSESSTYFCKSCRKDGPACVPVVGQFSNCGAPRLCAGQPAARGGRILPGRRPACGGTHCVAKRLGVRLTHSCCQVHTASLYNFCAPSAYLRSNRRVKTRSLITAIAPPHECSVQPDPRETCGSVLKTESQLCAHQNDSNLRQLLP